MKKYVCLIILSSIMSSCATVKMSGPTEIKNNIGFMWIETDKGLKVMSVISGSSASKSGLWEGDIIKEVNGIQIKKSEELFSFKDNHPPNRYSKLLIVRQGILKEIKIKPDQQRVSIGFKSSPASKISLLLSKNIPIHLTIIVGDISNTLPPRTIREREEFEKMGRSQILAFTENYYLDLFGIFPKFKLIDRYKIEDLLEEMHFQTTGMVSDEMRLRIGKMTGATHILYITFSRSYKGSYIYDSSFYSLINIEKGEIVGSITNVMKERMLK